MTASAYEGTIVLGAPRSGTTLLRRILDAHPEIACPGETNIFAGCGRLLHRDVINEGVDVGVLSGLSFAGFSETEVLDRLREFAFGFHRDFARRQNKPRWASKTAFDLFYLSAIESFCGRHARFIGIQRHGLDVACSIQELCEANGTLLPELHGYIQKYPRPLEAFAHVWADLTTSLLEFAQRHPENTLLLKYEDLVSEPEPVLRSIAAFLEVPFSEEWVERALQKSGSLGLGDWKTYGKRQLDPESIGRWRKLSAYTSSELGRICNPVLEACGYPAVPVLPLRTAEEGRRRYEFGLKLAGATKQPVKGDSPDAPAR